MEMNQKECGIVCKRKWYGANRKSNRGRMEIIKTI